MRNVFGTAQVQILHPSFMLKNIATDDYYDSARSHAVHLRHMPRV